MKLTFTAFFTLILFAFAGSAFAQEKDPEMLFFKNGEKYRKAGNLEKAISEYDHAIAINNKVPEIHYWKGMCHYKLRKSKEAAESLEKALEIDGDNPKYLNGLLKVYTSQHDHEKMVEVLNRMSDIANTDKQKIEYKLKGVDVLKKEDDYEDALMMAEAALEIDPYNLDALYHKGELSNKLGDHEKAKEALIKAVDLLKTEDPKVIARYYYELGLAYHKLGEYDKSDQSFVRANVGPYRAKIAKLKPGYYYNLAQSYNMIYEYDEAREMLDVALEIDKSYSQANMMLAEIAVKQEHHHKAIKHYKEAIENETEADRTQEKVYNQLIETLLNAKKHEEAIAVADEALEKFPGARNIIFMKGIALYKSEKPEVAVTTVEELLGDGSITPIETLMYNFALGIMYTSMKDKENAKVAFAKARRGPFANAAQHAFEEMEAQLSAEASEEELEEEGEEEEEMETEEGE